MNTVSKLYISVIAILPMLSCQKEIVVDLNSSSPAIVIQANVISSRNKCEVLLTQTVNFDLPNEFPAVRGASIVLTDSSANTSYNLVETKAGYYVYSNLQPIPQHVYKLQIETNGKVYASRSVMPDSVPVKSLIMSKETDGHGFGAEKQRIRYKLTAVIQDPKDVLNYYRFLQRYKGVIIGSSQPLNDNFRDGEIISQDLRINLGDTLQLIPGDTIQVELQSIDKGAYDFYRTFRQGGGGPGFQDAAPSNPLSNISNGAVGYFSTYNSTFKKVVVPK